MISIVNKRAGRCDCGAEVPVGKGLAVKNGPAWTVRCAGCAERGSDRTDELSAPQEASSGLDGIDYVLLSGHPASPYQAAVFDHFRSGTGSRIVVAVAGSGKTTTMKNALPYLSPSLSVQLFAFNVKAAEQLKDAIKELIDAGKIPASNQVRAGTFHSVGMYAVRRAVEARGATVTVDDRKCQKILRAQLGATPEGLETLRLYGGFATRLVGLAKGEGIGTRLRADTEEAWYDLVDHHGLYLESEEASIEVGVEVARRLLRWSNEAAIAGTIDYDDMLYLVVLWGLRLWRNHVVICDEAQDTNPVRRAMLHLALTKGGRLYAVGDPHQSIYGFTGASTDAMDRIAREFGAAEMPLTVSYRCARSIVAQARTWVPHIEAAAQAPEGEVRHGVSLVDALASLTAEDAVLCRQTAPLVGLAYSLISRGRACRVLGKEIGEGLVSLIEQQRARGIDGLVKKLEAWRDRETSKLNAKGEEVKAEAIEDRVNCVLVIVERLPETRRTVPALIARIREMFEDDGDGKVVLTLCTVHKAKGLEWPSVAILRPELMPSKAARQEWAQVQETHLMYVAATRAKNILIYCKDGDTTTEKELSASKTQETE